MRRMMSLLQLGVGVVLLCTVVVVPAATQQCNRVPHDNYGCQTFNLVSPDGARCQVATQGSPNFSFYLRPGTTFTSLQIIITPFLRSPTTIHIGRDELEQPNMWYHVQMTSHKSYLYFSYHVYIDGRERRITRVLFSGHTFHIYVIGSPYYASNCNPGDFPPPPQLLPTVPSPPAKLSASLSASDAVNTSLTPTVFPPARTAVIVGATAALAATVVVIVVVALEIKRRKKREEYERTRQSQEPPPIPMAFSEARKADRQSTYEDFEYLEHIYEEVDNLNLQLRSSTDCC